ncbi:hypothetical protein [Shewanella sp. KCT]|uniref:hypothetical protein n=1 Tax=Shewanella sp. KCT TaxID=2569535 RepID=UPI001181E511|nr:hypothetical protein [Shewanella sp. KCT]TVP08700.1 hypothetical protein AYI87_20930 [Shewanella sp. KCT]
MALTLPSISLSSGIDIANPLLVISELNVTNNASINERLEVAMAPGEGEQVNDGYKLVTNNHGGKGCTYMVSVFATQAAFEVGKPPVEVLRDDRSVKVFSVQLADAAYDGMTPRQAAYVHLVTQEGFEQSVEVDGVSV